MTGGGAEEDSSLFQHSTELKEGRGAERTAPYSRTHKAGETQRRNVLLKEQLHPPALAR